MTCWCGSPTAPRYDDTPNGPVIRKLCTAQKAHDPNDRAPKTEPRVLYLSGPMTGYPGANYPAFNEAAERLRGVGYIVFNPAQHGNRSSYRETMKADIALLMESDAVATLPNWWTSNGARVEVNLAGFLQMPVEPLELWIMQKEVMEVG